MIVVGHISQRSSGRAGVEQQSQFSSIMLVMIFEIYQPALSVTLHQGNIQTQMFYKRAIAAARPPTKKPAGALCADAAPV